MRQLRTRHKLGRGINSRIRLIRKLLTYMVQHDRIETTTGRARAIAPLAQKMMADAVENTPESRERIFNLLIRPELAMKVFGEMRERYASYGNSPVTRIWLSNFRQTDKMPRSIVEFVDAPFDIRQTLAMFAREKGIDVYSDAKLLTGTNPLDRKQLGGNTKGLNAKC